MAGLSATLLRAGRGSASLLRACGDSLASEERAERGLACTGGGTVDFDEADDFKDLKRDIYVQRLSLAVCRTGEIPSCNTTLNRRFTCKNRKECK